MVAAVPRLQGTGSAVVVRELSCPEACGIFPVQGLNPCLSALAGGFFTTGPSGKLRDRCSFKAQNTDQN